METVLVTGGAGFIGSHLCARLLDKGYRVFCVDNVSTSSVANIEKLLEHSQFTFLQEDVITTSFEKVTSKKIDYIFHLASPASPNATSPRSYIAYPIETLLVNSQGTHSLLELAKKHTAKFLFTSTSEIYGDPDVSPQPETYNGNVSPNGVRSVYDEAKRFGEAITCAYFRKYGVDVRIARLFNTYGPHMQKDDGRVVSNFINQLLAGESITIYGDGKQTRSFCYIDDMVEALMRLMFYEGTKGEVVNLGNPDERTIKELATIIKDLTKTPTDITFIPLPADDPRRRQPDITKAKKMLQWEPKVALEEGLTKTIAYFKSL